MSLDTTKDLPDRSPIHDLLSRLPTIGGNSESRPRIDQDPIPTGIIALDHELGGGVIPGKLYMVCAYTGEGKSSFAVHLACTATEFDHPALIFHSEMTVNDDYGPRLISCHTGIPFRDLRFQNTPYRSTPPLDKIEFVDLQDLNAGSIPVIREQIDSFKNKHGACPLIIVDTIDKVQIERNTWDTRLKLEAICAELAMIAEKKKVPIWATTQGNDNAYENPVVTTECLRDARGKAFPVSLMLGFGRKGVNSSEIILTADKSRDTEKFQIRVRADFACQRFMDLDADFFPFG